MKKLHKIENVFFQGDHLHITIDGRAYSFVLSEISQRLAKATEAERSHFEISPAGYGIHWPLLDEDLSIDGLLGIRHAPASKQHGAVT
ncbi:MAG: DUF2442 domain-containing protein [Candidatus Zixiibacteriota bacterium]|nr:MAG: DUF2442 domain-containing protein [candidate division Zixibacteria bacterium]